MLFPWNVTDVAGAKALTEITARSLKPQLWCASATLPLKSGVSHSLGALVGCSVCAVDVSSGALHEPSCSPAALREVGDLADSSIHWAGRPDRQFLFLALLLWAVVWPSVSHCGGLAVVCSHAPTQPLSHSPTAAVGEQRMRKIRDQGQDREITYQILSQLFSTFLLFSTCSKLI